MDVIAQRSHSQLMGSYLVDPARGSLEIGRIGFHACL